MMTGGQANLVEKEKQKKTVTKGPMIPDLYERWLERQQPAGEKIRAKSGFIGDREIGESGEEEGKGDSTSSKSKRHAVE